MEANLMMALVVFGVLFLTLAAGIWVGFSLFIVGFVGMLLYSSLPAGNNMASSLWATVEKWEYVALPLFILMGEILTDPVFPKNFSKHWYLGCIGFPADCC